MVGVDRPIKALSMHIQKPYKGIIVLVLTAVILSKIIFFFNQTPSCICSMCLHCIGKVSNGSIKSCGREVDWPMKAPSMHIQKPY